MKNKKYIKNLSYDYLLRSAYRYLERYATTELNLEFILSRKVERILNDNQLSSEKREDIAKWIKKIVQSMVDNGIVNDRLFAESRARSLIQLGNSLSVIQNKLRAKGVPQKIIDDVLKLKKEENPNINRLSAIRYAKKRRFGPFRIKDKNDAETKELAAMARAGFAYSDAIFTLRAIRSDLEDILYDHA